MSNPNITLKWKITKVLENTPPCHKNNIVFNISPNPGLYNQFGLSPIYVPKFFDPTIVFQQTIKNRLKKQDIIVDDYKFPYNIYIPKLNAKVSLSVKIRLFPSNILSLTVTVSGFPHTLDAAKLIDYQDLRQLKPISDIIQWTIGMAETLNHKNFNSLQSFNYKPTVYLEEICQSEKFQNHIEENISKYIGVLIRNYDFNAMDDKIQENILEKNKKHNLKSLQEKYLIDKQGILYITPLNKLHLKSKTAQFSKTHDLFEIAIVFGEYLSQYLSFRLLNEDLADFFIYEIQPWIENPEIVFRMSVSNETIWKLLISELKLKKLMQFVTNPPIRSIVVNKSQYFSQFSYWWKSPNFEYLLTKKIEKSKDLQLDFLENEDLKRLIIEDYGEAKRSLQSKNYKATILLCGSIAEAILTAVIEKARLPGINTKKLYNNFNLSKLLDIAKNHDLVIDKNIFSLIDPLRNYRNIIHPGVQLRKSISPDLSKATIALETIKLLLEDLKINKTQKKNNP